MPAEKTAYPTATAWVPMEGKPGQTKIVIFVDFGGGTKPEQQAVHQKIQAEFNSTHDKTQIEFLTVPWPERINRFSDLLAKDIAPDIVMPIGVGGISEFYNEWADLTPYILKNRYDMSRFIGRTVEIQKYPERGVLGLPMCVYPTAVFYNKDIFDAASVAYPPQKAGENYADSSPWDYKMMVEIAMKLSLDANGNDADSPAFDSKNMMQWGWEGWDWFNNINWRPEYNKITDIVIKMWVEMYSGKNLDVNALLDMADHEVQALLDEYWQNH